MRTSAIVIASALLASACAGAQDQPANGTSGGDAGAQPDRRGSGEAAWDLQSSGEGVALALVSGDTTIVRLFCPADSDELLVNVPAFRPVGSEERMSFGSGGNVVALVADSAGDQLRGGVTGSGPVPSGLAELIAGPVAVNYGSQNSGAHPAPPPQQARAFAAACAEGVVAQEAESTQPATPVGQPRPPQNAGACTVQNGQPVPANRLRAVGTEPFWGARIEGRCVTYSHPENQAGTRIWTTFSGSAEAGTWTGFYDNQRFVLRTRPQAGCSDGMSDNRYPIAVALEVGGEQRSGCADRL